MGVKVKTDLRNIERSLKSTGNNYNNVTIRPLKSKRLNGYKYSTYLCRQSVLNSLRYATDCYGLLRTKMRVFGVMSDRENGNLSNWYDDGLIMRVRQRKHRIQELMDAYMTMNRGGWKLRTSQKVSGNIKKITEILGNVYPLLEYTVI
jgi:hypothetical protein